MVYAMRRRILLGLGAPFLLVGMPAAAKVIIDPDLYSCVEQTDHDTLGTLQANLSVNVKSGDRSFEANWRSNSKTPYFEAYWHGDDLAQGRLFITSYGVQSPNMVRLEIGECGSNPMFCNQGSEYTAYATNFAISEGAVRARTIWGIVVLIGERTDRLFFKVRDEQTGTVIREDKIDLATLFAVEQEIARMRASLEAKTVDLDTVAERCG